MTDEKLKEPIDAVITWVNGNDPEWQARINKYAPVKINFDRKKEGVRYNSIGEIDTAIRSIIKYAPYVRNIFLVTDNQKPESFEILKGLAKTGNINLEVIDHRVTFRGLEECLPCFNSCSIGCTLFRIPGLAEHFIVFNDDTFLMRRTQPTDFFIKGKPIIRGKREEYREDRQMRTLYHYFRRAIGKPVKIKKTSFKKFQQTSARLAGSKTFVRRFHTPVSIRKSTLDSFFESNDLLKENVKFRFRNENQFIISSLSEHLEIKNNTFHFRRNTQLTYFRSYKNLLTVKLKLHNFRWNKNKLFMTFQSLEMAEQNILDYILKWIDNRLR